MVNIVVRKALWVEYWMIVTSLHVYWLRKIHYNNSVNNNIYCSFEGKLAKGIQELLIIYNRILECWKGYDGNLKCNRTFVMMLKKKIDRNLPYIYKKKEKFWSQKGFWIRYDSLNFFDRQRKRHIINNAHNPSEALWVQKWFCIK